MAKTQKYSDDQLLTAVLKYTEIEKKKIKATELAKWCRENMEGLEEVRDYHFTRPIKKRDDKTGKVVDKQKLCTLKIEEINKSRSLIVSINTNLLLRASNIDTFMNLPNTAKRKMIVETRETVDKLLNRNGIISRENAVLKEENKMLKTELLGLVDRIDELQKVQGKLQRQVTYVMKELDEEARKEMLSQMGIIDGSIDLDVYVRSLQQELSDVMNINKVLRKRFANITENESLMENPETLIEDIMSGLKF